MDDNQNNSAYIPAPNKKTAREYSLLLDSLSIANNAVFRWNSWQIEVGLPDYEKAKSEISAYEASGRIEKIPNKFAHIRFQKVDWIQFILTLALLAAFHVFIYESGHLELIKAGRSSAAAITEGEFFRAVTALTLHGDYKHLFSNIVFGGIVLWALSTMTGTGFALLFALFTGFAGNVMNAFFYGSAHNSIGASTSVFGVIGVLAGLQFFDSFREKKLGRWIPFGAALGLLAMLGSSEKSDVLAHLFGFVAGLPAGMIFGALFSKRDLPGRTAQNISALLFVSVIFTCWIRAVS
ncbi:rhomboid family intramembrane serine protease [bacterium]|nr:rhomboid family intramembrane serine protease [bacterium]MBP5591794.1 rhomboid family intramembrane serine protease [bacterium]